MCLASIPSCRRALVLVEARVKRGKRRSLPRCQRSVRGHCAPPARSDPNHHSPALLRTPRYRPDPTQPRGRLSRRGRGHPPSSLSAAREAGPQGRARRRERSRVGTRRGPCSAGAGPEEGACLWAMIADREGVSRHGRAWGSPGRCGQQWRIQMENTLHKECPHGPHLSDHRARLLPPSPAAPCSGGLLPRTGCSAGRSAGEPQFLQGYQSGERRAEGAGGGEDKRFSSCSLCFRPRRLPAGQRRATPAALPALAPPPGR